MLLSQLAICVRTSQMKLTPLLIAFSIATPCCGGPAVTKKGKKMLSLTGQT